MEINIDYCTWTEDEDGVWDTSCGDRWEFTAEGGPTKHGCLFCHACGAHLKAVAFVDAPVEDEAD